MDINFTLFGQFITFSILVWFTMRYVWPPITKAMRNREKKIAEGLSFAERSKRELETAEHKALGIIRDAKQQATQIIETANMHSAKLVEEAKSQAKHESDRIVAMAQSEIEREVQKSKEELKSKLAELAIAGAEKILQREIDARAQESLLTQLAAEL